MSADKERDQFARDIATSAAAQRSVDASVGAGPPPAAPPPPDDAEQAAQAFARGEAGGAPPVDPRQAMLQAAQPGYVPPYAPPTRVMGANGQMQDAPPEVPAGMPPQNVVRAQDATQTPQPAPSGPPGVPFNGASYDAEARDIEAQGAAETAKRNAQIVSSGLVGQEYRQGAEDDAKRFADQAAQSQRQLADIHRMSDDAAKMGVDPSRWWHNQGTGDKVRYTLAAMLGGFAAGWTHGPNQALAQINRYIDDDIGAQKTAIDQAHGRVSDQRNLLAEMTNRFGDINKGIAATRMLKINGLLQEGDAQSAAADSPEIAARWDVAKQHLLRAKADDARRFAAMGQGPALGQASLGKLSEEYGKAGIPEAQNAVDRVAEIAAQPDPAGFGLFSRAAHALGADWMIPQEGLNNRAALDQAVLKIAHATGRVTPQEIEAVRRGYLGAVENPAALKQFVEGVQSEITAKKANIQAGADPRAVALQGAVTKAYDRRANKPGLPSGSTP